MDSKEKFFFKTYCQAEVGQILRAVSHEDSIVVVGLAGMGKSNVLRFIANNSEARLFHLGPDADQLAIVSLDCNWMENCADPALIFQEMALTLAKLANHSLPAATLQQPKLALAEALEALPLEQLPVFMIDRFDLAASSLPATFYNTLRYLRDQRTKRVSYVFGARRLPENMHELTELFVDPCYVGPLTYPDASDSLDRDEKRLKHRFQPAEREQLLAVTGGYPALRKSLAELVADGRVNLTEAEEKLAAQLTTIPIIYKICAELWNDLTPIEQTVLDTNLIRTPISVEEQKALESLRRYGLLHAAPPGRLAFFSPIFSAFVRQQQVTPQTVTVILEPPLGVRLQEALGEKHLSLAPLRFKLLDCLVRAPLGVMQEEDLDTCVYGKSPSGLAEGFERLRQNVHRTGGELDTTLREVTGDKTYRSIVNLQGAYQLNSRTANGTAIVWKVRDE